METVIIISLVTTFITLLIYNESTCYDRYSNEDWQYYHVKKVLIAFDETAEITYTDEAIASIKRAANVLNIHSADLDKMSIAGFSAAQAGNRMRVAMTKSTISNESK